LISHTYVLEPKGHGRVATGAEGRDERRLDLVFFLQRNLEITIVAIYKAQEIATGHGIYDLVNVR
jgi:hypothetical protein